MTKLQMQIYRQRPNLTNRRNQLVINGAQTNYLNIYQHPANDYEIRTGASHINYVDAASEKRIMRDCEENI